MAKYLPFPVRIASRYSNLPVSGEAFGGDRRKSSVRIEARTSVSRPSSACRNLSSTTKRSFGGSTCWPKISGTSAPTRHRIGNMNRPWPSRSTEHGMDAPLRMQTILRELLSRMKSVGSREWLAAVIGWRDTRCWDWPTNRPHWHRRVDVQSIHLN